MRRPNTTFDLYRGGALPPAAPDEAGLTGHLTDRWARGNETNEGHRAFLWTATLEVPLDTNIPDQFPVASSNTTVWVPDQGGAAYTVVFVERERTARGREFKRVYLIKGANVSIIVQEADGSPIVAAVTVLVVDQADGFVVSSPGAGQARLDIQPAGASQAGVVSTAAQSFSGAKTFLDDIVVGDPTNGAIVNFYSTPGANSQVRCLPSGGGTSKDTIEIRAMATPGTGLTHFTSLTVSAHLNYFQFDCGGGHSGPPDIFIRSASGLETAKTGTQAGMTFTSGLWTSGTSTAVTSVSASSPLASSGGTTPTVSIPNQSANQVLAGPTSGGAAAPAFRTLVPADMPTQSAVSDASALTSVTVADSTGGTNNDTVNDVGGSFDQTTLNDNFASIVENYNRLRTDLTSVRTQFNALLAQLRNFKAIA